MDAKLFKKTFPYICGNCHEFAHTMNDFCEKCGSPSLRKATNKEFKGRK